MPSPVHDDDTDYSDLDEEPQSAHSNAEGQRPLNKNRERLSERTPLIDNYPPPPTYADVTRNDPPAGAHNNTHGRPSGNNAAQATPQSMGDPYKDPEDNQTQKKRSYWFNPKVLVVLAIALVTTIIALSVTATKHSNKNNSNNEKDKHPPTKAFPHYATCGYDWIGNLESFGFNPPSAFSMIEITDSDNVPSVNVHGQVRVVSASESQDSAIYVKLLVAKSSSVTGLHLYIDNNEGGFTIRPPSIPNDKPKACMELDIEISIRPGTSLESIEIATEHLDVIIEPGLFPAQEDYYISNTTNIIVASGKLTATYWASRRETKIDVTTGSVGGRFALRDLLTIRTRTGSINIEVDPKPIDPTAPRPAEFSANSQTGSVEVVFPLHGDIPDREYHTGVETSTGSVRGRYILGVETDIRTNSGSIDLVVMPFTSNASSWLRTESNVGRTFVNVLSPFDRAKHMINHMRSSHKTRSGSVDLIYPQEWSGVVEAATLVGSIDLSGRDLEILKRWHGPGGAHVLAQKGEGKSSLDVSTTTGSIKAAIGDTT